MILRSNSHSDFWASAFAWSGSVTPMVTGRVLMFTFLSIASTTLCLKFSAFQLSVGLLEVSGAVIGLLLIIRTNAGYDRWWEARKLWGGIVNQSRNLALIGIAYGPKDKEWQREFVKNVTEFPQLTIKVLRGGLEKNLAYISSSKVALLLGQAYQCGQIRESAFLAAEKQRAALIDHLGACERILKSPLPMVLDIKVRRFLMIYLLLVPVGLVSRIGWYTPMLTFFLSYFLLALDQIGIELQNPFSEQKLSSLPLEEISSGIEKQIRFMEMEIAQNFDIDKNDLSYKFYQLEPESFIPI